MKILKSVLFIAIILLAFTSCQKELVFNNDGVSKGVFKKDASGNCLPVVVNGFFKVDTALTNASFVDIQVNVTTPGTFDMRTDTVNGYAFNKVGSVVFGLNTIRLYAKGTPIAAGKNTFTVKYGLGGGESTCTFDITVTGPAAPPATFTLAGSPGQCTAAIIGGTYTVGVALTPANTLTVQVDVATLGSYVIVAASPSGSFNFAGSGVFTTTGVQNVTLTASGTVSTAGVFTFSVTNMSSTCTYDVTVVPVGGPPAVFTLDGAPNACTSFTVAGTYAQGIAVTVANTVKLNVTVTTAGSYTITTSSLNGITFSGTGVLALGAQTITLTATGTPIAQGTFNYKPNVTTTCGFDIVVAPPPPPAVYTLSGAPGACAPITVNGTYFTNTALNASNTVDVQVNVTTAGTYTLSTNTVNGMKFSATGLFTATGLQTVTLSGSGTPGATATTSTLTPQIGTSTCTFDVPVNLAPDGVFTCKINNVAYNFATLAEGYYSQPNDLSMSGKSTAGTGDDLILGINKTTSGQPVTTGTYVNTLAGTLSGKYLIDAVFFDAASSVNWSPKSVVSGSPDPFTIIITQISATRVKGTFSGTIRDVFGTGTNTKTITEGVFDLPIH